MLKKTYSLLCLMLTFTTFAQSPKELVKQAQKNFISKNYVTAIYYYTKALELKPQDFNIIIARAIAYEESHDIPNAINDYKQAVALKSKEEELYIKVADLSISINDYNTAAMYLEKFLILNPSNIDALQKISYAYLMLKQFQAALDKLNKADKNKMTNLGHYYRALVLDSLSEYGSANIEYNTAIKMMEGLYEYPKKPDAKFKPYYANHALVLYRLGNNDEAIKEYEKAVSLDRDNYIAPSQFLIYYLEHQPYVRKGDFANAIACLNKSIALNPNYIDAFFARAGVYKKTSNFHSANSDYTKILQLEPQNSEAYFGRGQCQIELGDYQNAV